MVGKTAGPVIRAVVVDVDGTVLRSDQTISPATRHAVAEVIGLGVPVILASSRSPRGLEPVQAALGLVGQYLVAFQGALTGRISGILSGILTGRNADDFEVLDELPLELWQARDIAVMASAAGYSVSWYAGTNWHVDTVDNRVRREASVTGETPVVADLLRLTSAPHKLLCIGPDGTSPGQLRQMAARMPAGTVGRRSHSSYLEVTASAADKPTGVRALGEHLGFDADGVVAFGDGENDLGMFAYAGTLVAMGNATPALLAAATMTTTSQDEDGVALALRRLIDNGSISG